MADETRRERIPLSRNRVLVLVVLLLLIVLVLFLVWWWFRPRTEPTTPSSPPVEDTVVLPQDIREGPTPEPVPQPEPLNAGEAQIRNLARNFTERYGSFSTDSQYQNLRELYPYSTASLRVVFEDIIDEAVPAGDFRGVETTVINISIVSQTESTAEVVVMAQRVETNAALEQSVTYETLELSMVRAGEFWLVDEVAWQN